MATTVTLGINSGMMQIALAGTPTINDTVVVTTPFVTGAQTATLTATQANTAAGRALAAASIATQLSNKGVAAVAVQSVVYVTGQITAYSSTSNGTGTYSLQTSPGVLDLFVSGLPSVGDTVTLNGNTALMAGTTTTTNTFAITATPSAALAAMGIAYRLNQGDDAGLTATIPGFSGTIAAVPTNAGCLIAIAGLISSFATTSVGSAGYTLPVVLGGSPTVGLVPAGDAVPPFNVPNSGTMSMTAQFANAGSASVNVTGVQPYALTAASPPAACGGVNLGQPPVGAGQPVTVAASNGTLSMAWPASVMIPSVGTVAGTFLCIAFGAVATFSDGTSATATPVAVLVYGSPAAAQADFQGNV